MNPMDPELIAPSDSVIRFEYFWRRSPDHLLVIAPAAARRPEACGWVMPGGVTRWQIPVTDAGMAWIGFARGPRDAIQCARFILDPGHHVTRIVRAHALVHPMRIDYRADWIEDAAVWRIETGPSKPKRVEIERCPDADRVTLPPLRIRLGLPDHIQLLGEDISFAAYRAGRRRKRVTAARD